MANIILAPIKAVGSAMGSAIQGANNAFNYVGRRVAAEISLIPVYLQNLRWLISGKFLQLSTQGYGTNSAVYACLKFLSQSIPEPPLLAYSVSAGGKETPLKPDHPLMQLIHRPNPWMTEYEFKELTTLHLGIVGRSTWWKERNNDGSIRALWPLRPDRVGPIYDKGVVLSGWSYLVPGTVNYVGIPAADVVLFNFPDPSGDSGGMVEGLGPLQVLAAEIGADNEATRYVGALLANSAVPGAVLKTKASITDQKTADILKAAFNREWGGIKRGSVAVLDGDSDITMMGFNLQQLEFPTLRKVSESRIAACIGVPPVLVGLLVGLEASGAYASINAMRQIYAETTCESYWVRLENVYTRDVAAEFDAGIVTRHDRRKVKALNEQMAGETNKYVEAFKAGAVSYDTYRDKVLGLPPLPVGGDRRVLPRGSIEIDENGNIIPIPLPTPPTPPPGSEPMNPELPPDGTPQETPPKEAVVAQNGHGKPKPPTKAVTRITVSAKPTPADIKGVMDAYDAWAAESQAELLDAS